MPDDLIDVELGSLYPELKHMRLRGRLEGRKLVPYYARAEWDRLASRQADHAIVWADDPLDVFFMQIQGSGQVVLDDGSRIRVGYADQNGHPYRSIGRWLIDQGELKVEQASMQGIRQWLKATYPNSERALTRLMNAQDTGGAIRGPVRADFFWGSGIEAGNQAGKMRQKGQMWLLLPPGYSPSAPPR